MVNIIVNGSRFSTVIAIPPQAEQLWAEPDSCRCPLWVLNLDYGQVPPCGPQFPQLQNERVGLEHAFIHCTSIYGGFATDRITKVGWCMIGGQVSLGGVIKNIIPGFHLYRFLFIRFWARPENLIFNSL